MVKDLRKVTSLIVVLAMFVSMLVLPPVTVQAETMEQLLQTIRSQFIAEYGDAPLISNVVYPESVGMYKKFEVDFKLQADYENPFDPEDINVLGHFTMPGGNTVTVPAFYYKEYTAKNGKTTTAFTSNLYSETGKEGWKLRFSGETQGEYSFYITATDSLGRTETTEEFTFSITYSESKGYVQISETNPNYFEYSRDNSLFYGIGSNIPYINANDINDPANMPGGQKTYPEKHSYEYFLNAAGGNANATRVWICNWRWLEWMPDPANVNTVGYGGLGYYNQMVSSMLDRVFAMAEEEDLRVILTLDDNNEMETGSNSYEAWGYHPYNIANGGPASSVEDYWRNSEVREIYKKRLRYIAARWGYSESLWALNQWNDYSNPTPDVVDYLHEMRDYTHTLFEGWRPILYASNYGGAADEFMDYAQFGKSLFTDKPKVVQECYYSAELDWFYKVLQEQMWEGLVSGNATRLIWRYGDVERFDAWKIFKYLTYFVSDIPLNEKMWTKTTSSVSAASLTQPVSRMIEAKGYGDMGNFGEKARENNFTIDITQSSQYLEGFAAGSLYQGHVLYGSKYPEWRNPPTFNIYVPESGEMLIRFKQAMPGPHTVTTVVNGLPGPSISWNYAEKMNNMKGYVPPEEEFLSIPLAQGNNTITLDLTGEEWVRISNIFFILGSNDPSSALSVSTMVADDNKDAFLYILNQTNTELYKTILNGEHIVVEDIQCTIPGLVDGTYNIAMFDPTTGAYTGTMTAESQNGALEFTIPSVVDDLAIKVRHTDLPINNELPDPNALTGIRLDAEGKTLYKGVQTTLTAIPIPEAGDLPDVVWSSDDESVATVDENGVVTAVDIGDAVITATVIDPKTGDPFAASCSIKVQQAYIPLFSDNFENDTAGSGPAGWNLVTETGTVKVVSDASAGQSVEMNRTISSGIALNAIRTIDVNEYNGKLLVETDVFFPDTNQVRLLWIRNPADKDLIRVAFAKDGVINTSSVVVSPAIDTGLSYLAGTWIPVKLEIDTEMGKYLLNVNNGQWIGPYEFITAADNSIGSLVFQLQKVTSFRFDNVKVSTPAVMAEAITLDIEEETLTLCDTIQLNAEITPEDTSYTTLEWTSSDESVATVDDNGLVTTVGPGTATISVKLADQNYGTASDNCTITVVSPVTAFSVTPDAITVLTECRQPLIPTITPVNATHRTIIYSSDNPSVATVDALGRVSGISEGTATITATLDDPISGNRFTETSIVTVDAFTAIIERFDDHMPNEQPSGWTINQSGTDSVTVVGDDDGQVVRMQKDSTTNNVLMATKDVGGLYGEVIVKASIYPTASNKKARVMAIKNSKGDEMIRFALGYDGHIKVSDGDKGDAINSGMMYAKDTWYNTAFYIDTENGTYTLTINGETVGTYELRKDSFEVGSIYFTQRSAYSDLVLIDNVYVGKQDIEMSKPQIPGNDDEGNDDEGNDNEGNDDEDNDDEGNDEGNNDEGKDDEGNDDEGNDNEDNGSNNSGGSSNNSGNTEPKNDASVVIGGAAISGSVPVAIVSERATVDLKSLAGEIFAGNEDATIKIPSIPGVTAYTLEIPATLLSGADKNALLTFETNVGSVRIQPGMLSSIPYADQKSAGITIAAGDKSKLPGNVKAAIGNRPLTEITLMVDGKQTAWNNPEVPVTVSIPYAPTAAELENPESIIVWYIDGSGNMISVPNGRYDPVSGTVIFTTTHFSHFAVGYKKVSFNDVSENAWYKRPVSFIAARGITSGTGNGNYSPSAKLTRSEFIVLLMKAYDIAPDTMPADNFADAGNTYYTGYLAAAKRLGLSAGIGNNMFGPGKQITRQEMFTMMYNALELVGKFPQGDTGKSLSDFDDAGQINPWAKDAMTLMVKTGTVEGYAGKLSPTLTTTRAEMAQLLYKLLSK